MLSLTKKYFGRSFISEVAYMQEGRFVKSVTKVFYLYLCDNTQPLLFSLALSLSDGKVGSGIQSH